MQLQTKKFRYQSGTTGKDQIFYLELWFTFRSNTNSRFDAGIMDKPYLG